MTINKLSNHLSANAHVGKLDDGTIVLMSYYTKVIIVDANGWMTVTGLYSATTRKHIGWFMRDYYGLTYQHAKQAYNDNMLFNVYTGEYKRMEE